MEKRVELSVGLTQDFANSESRAKFIVWLEIQAPVSEQARDALEHIHAVEGLLAAEEYAALSNEAGKLREELGKIHADNVNEFNKGFQAAINLIMLDIEDIDLDTQAATSIAEMQAAAVRGAQELCSNNEDYQAIGNYAQALIDGRT